MVQTTFTAGDGTSLATVLLDISSGTDAAINTAYTITMTAPILAASETVSLETGSSVELVGTDPFIVNAFTVTGSLITDLNFTGTVTLDNGAFDNVTLTSNGLGTIVAGEYTGAVLGTLGDSGDSAVNNGTIDYNATFAAVEFGSGTVQNGWNGAASALISGVAGGVALETSGLVQNGGSILASGATAAAVFMGAGTVDNGQIGDLGAQISGADNGVEITGAGVVDNDGTITGVASDAVYLGSGTVTNGQIGDSTALISGGPADNGVWIGTGAGTVNNFGTITGGGASGVFLAAGGTVNNGASADIAAQINGAFEGVLLGAAGSVSNAATIQASGNDATQSVIGVFLENGGSIANTTTASAILGREWGAIVEGAAGTVTNDGLIQASAAGSGLGVDLSAGGTVTNAAGATISGGFDGVRISAGAAGAGAAVQNDGTISGGVGVDFRSGPTPAAGTLTNDGVVESSGGTSGTAVEFGAGAETLVLQSAGTIVGQVLGDNAAGSSTTMELAVATQGTLSGLGSDAGTVTDATGSFGFSALGTIAIDAGASWTVAAPGTMDTVNNAGALGVSGGAVTVSGLLGNSGALSIASGASLTAADGVVTDQGVITVGAGAAMTALGGGITAAGTADIQVGGGSSATLNVAGTGATVSSTHGIGIGVSGQGSGLISQGGTMLAATPFAAAEAIFTGGSAGATGALTISDPGSKLDATGQFAVGLSGDGSLLVENQATAVTGGDTADASEGFEVGQLAGAAGQATVTGVSSLLTNTGRFVVGDAGLGSLAIDAGGTVTTTPGTSGLAGVVIANTAGAAGSAVDVSGAGSRLNVTGLLDVGVSGSGALELSGGATVTAGSLDAANVAAAVAQISLSGTGTDLVVTNGATVADDGTGVLSVLSGATFSASSLTIGSQGDSSGAAVVSGSGSVMNLSGALNIGTANGTGDLTVGPGAAIQAQAVFEQGQVVLEGGLLDPTVQLINQGQTAGGFGTIAAGDIVDEGAIQAGGNKGSQKLLIVQGTVLGGGTLTVNGTQPGSVPAGILQINAGGTLELSGAVLNAATTTFTDNLTPQGTYTVNNSVIDVNFVDDAGVLLLDDIAGFAGTITTYQAGDRFVITGGTLSGVTVSNGDTLLVSDSSANAGPDGIDQIIFNAPVNPLSFKVVNGNTVEAQALPCFAAGSRIATERGLVAVEDLLVGDRAITGDGQTAAPIVWIGQRLVDCRAHPRPRSVWPVRVAAGAFGSGTPTRDLYLSPDHAVYVNDVLVPVKLLINGSSIEQEPRDQVTYFHVELPHHAVILSEGLPVESYLDIGDRADFMGEGTIRLFPDFTVRPAPLWEALGAAPLVTTGEALAAARRMVVPRVAAA